MTALVELVDRLSLRQKVRLLTGASLWTLPAEPAIGLRTVVMSDGPVGVRGQRYDERQPSWCLPTPSAVGATWDVDVARRLGELLGDEARRKGVDVVLAPTVNIQRDPRNGRTFENLSEDPVLVADLGCAVITGIQSRGVAATAKHLVANDFETERFTADVVVDETTLREVYLAPFEAAVRAGAVVVMAAYNSVNGTTMTEHPLLRDVLKEEWGFAGPVVSDWFAARRVDAAGPGLLDVVMPGPVDVWDDALVDAVERGEVERSAIDDKVLRLLELAAFVGALDPPADDTAFRGADEPEAMPEPEAAALVRHAAALGMVLLRNEAVTPGGDAVLPLAPDVGSIAVVGDLAEHTRLLGGGSATVFPDDPSTFAAGLVAAAPPGCRVTVVGGGSPDPAAAPIPPDHLEPVDGGDGMALTYRGTDGAVLGEEHRRATVVWWPPEGSAGVPWDDIAEISGRAVLRPRRTGHHRIAVAAPGTTQLTVGTATAEASVVPPPDESHGMAPRPPAEVAVELDLVAGEPVPIRFRHRPDPGHRDGGTTLGLTVKLVDDEAERAAIDAAAAAAASHEVAVVVVGTGPSVESEGLDRSTLALPGRQDDLVRAVAAANPRTVVVVNSGAPVLMPWVDDVAAVLVAWFPGQEAGRALADVVFGLAEPGGRLPLTWPSGDDLRTSVTPVEGRLAYDEGLAVGYRNPAVVAGAAFPFGAGLGYTSWAGGSTELVVDEGGATVQVSLRNTGARRGREVLAAWAESAARPGRRLVGFAAATAAAGATVEVAIRIGRRRLEHWEPGHGWTLPGTPTTVTVGRLAGDELGRHLLDTDTWTTEPETRP